MELDKDIQYVGGKSSLAKASKYKRYMFTTAAALVIAIMGLSYVAITMGDSETSVAAAESYDYAESSNAYEYVPSTTAKPAANRSFTTMEIELDDIDKSNSVFLPSTTAVSKEGAVLYTQTENMFTSPSKKVTCLTDQIEFVHCFVLGQDWDIKISDQVVCDGAGSPQGVEILNGEAQIGCGDWFFVESSTILDYGETYEIGKITCASKKIGIQCNHINGESFTAGPNIYPLDTVENNRSFVTSTGNIFCTGETGVRCTLNYNNQTSEGTDCEYLPKAVGSIQTLLARGVLSHHDGCVLDKQELNFEKNLPILKDGESIEFGQILCKYMNPTLSCKHANANGFSMDEKNNLTKAIID